MTINRSNIDKKGRASVEINGKVTKELLALIEANGGKVTASYKAEGQILAKIPLAALPIIAADSHVKTIDEPERFTTNVGAVTSQGYITHRANNVVEGLGITGSGIKVGVLSDSASATTVATLEGTGDLPTNTVVLNPGSGEDEGCAIMEIIHDLAPGAQPYFNTGTTAATFATAITALGTAGCTVIVDDISFTTEGVFQDDVIAQAINAFVASAPGNIYFSSAANSGNLDSGTAGCWEGDFLSGGTVVAPESTTDAAPSLIHNFGTAANPVLYDTLTVSTTGISLKWSDPLTGGTDDYDLFVLDSTGSTVIASSHARQTGTRAPVESVSSTAGFAIGDRIVIVQYDTAYKDHGHPRPAPRHRTRLLEHRHPRQHLRPQRRRLRPVDGCHLLEQRQAGHRPVHRFDQSRRAFQLRWTPRGLLQPQRHADWHRHADLLQPGWRRARRRGG